MFGYRPSLFRYIALRIYRQPWGRNTPNRSLHASSSEQSQHQDTYNILFFGRDEFSCIVFKELYAARDVWERISIVTHPDGKTGRHRAQPSVSQLKILGECVHIPVHAIPVEKSMIKSWKPPSPFTSFSVPPLNHILVTASFGRILPSPLLRLFDPARRLNVHPSLLPAYRGAAPIERALLSGDTQTGVCVIEMMERAKGIDAGAIWGCKKVPIPDESSFPPLRDSLAREGGKLLVSVLRDMLAGKAVSTPQPTHPVSRAPAITAADSIIDPATMTAEDIVRRHRAISHQRPLIVHLPTRKTLQLHFPSLYNVPADVSLPTIPGTAMYHPSTRTLLIRCTPQASPFLSDSEVSGTISPSPSLTSILSVPHVKQEGRALLHAKEWWNGVKGIGVVHGGVVRLSGGLSDM